MRKMIYLVACFAILQACKKENVEPGPASFDEVVEGGGEFEPAVRSSEVLEEEESTDVIAGEVWNCTTKTYSALEPGGGNNGFPLFNPNASVIYPGSLLQGNSLKQELPTLLRLTVPAEPFPMT